ncbi:hypothetical protein FRC16_010022 [Serendipita sp. 398]|nr:hypothetical protein FRC16_010022 [Serendipita sp. 398]
MSARLHIPDELVHPGWKDHQEAADNVIPNLISGSLEGEKDSMVRLEFANDGQPSSGTAFIVKIPGSKKTVILTAAHNLRSSTLKPTTNLQAVFRDGKIVAIDHATCYVPPEYKGSDSSIGDWAAIFLDKSIHGDKGFNFSLALSYTEKIQGEVSVIAYRDPTPAYSPEIASGRCKTCFEEQVEYLAKTEQGNSGAPVCVAYRGYMTVIAIHNRRPAYRKGGSTGARLTRQLMMKVFELSGALETDVMLRGWGDPRGKKYSVPRGLHLIFPEDWTFGRVRLGTGSKFDVIPVYSGPEGDRYALWTTATSATGKWVRFDVPQDQVELVDILKDESHFAKSNVSKTGWMKIVVDGPKEDGTAPKRYQLSLAGTMIMEGDPDDEETSEVSFVEYPKEEDDKIVKISFIKA